MSKMRYLEAEDTIHTTVKEGREASSVEISPNITASSSPLKAPGIFRGSKTPNAWPGSYRISCTHKLPPGPWKRSRASGGSGSEGRSWMIGRAVRCSDAESLCGLAVFDCFRCEVEKDVPLLHRRCPDDQLL